MTIEEKLAQAFRETLDERTERLMKIEKPHRFSLAYRLWERKVLRDFRRGKTNSHWTLKKARGVVAAGIAAASLVVGGTAFAAINTGRYGFVDKRDYSKMLIENHPSDKTEIEEYYGLPEEKGFEITYFSANALGTVIRYERGENVVDFNQRIIHEGNMGHISTDRAKVEMLSLYDESDGFMLDFGEDGIVLFWIYDGYLLELHSNLTKDETINLAYSTKIVDFQKFF